MPALCSNSSSQAKAPPSAGVRPSPPSTSKKITAAIQDKRLNSPVRRIESVSATPTQAAGVRISTDAGQERFDKVIIATHANQALALLAAPNSLEQGTLGAIGTQSNRAVLHTDVSVLPWRQAAWAAWNYERAPATVKENARVCLHYLINRLQPLPWQQPVLVSLNPARDIDPAKILGSFDYAHPVFDQTAVAAQGQMYLLQGQQSRYYCGAWMGYGFHEDGLKAGLAAAQKLLADATTSGTPA